MKQRDLLEKVLSARILLSIEKDFTPFSLESVFIYVYLWFQSFLLGGPMPKYVTLHTLACLTRQGAEHLASRLAAAADVKAQRVQVNLVEGKMLVEFESSDRETLEAWLKKNGFHFDWLLRVELESEGGPLVSV